LPIDFNQRVGVNLQRYRKAKGFSQSDLAEQLSARGLPFQQQTVLKVEKGARPLRFEEACAIAEILRIKLASMSEHIGDDRMAVFVVELMGRTRRIAMARKGIEELREETRRKEEELCRQIEDLTKEVCELEDQLPDIGAVQDDEGRWHWDSDDGRHFVFGPGWGDDFFYAATATRPHNA
jgi:transcriptional regulator with XRE-family HTH domain